MNTEASVSALMARPTKAAGRCEMSWFWQKQQERLQFA